MVTFASGWTLLDISDIADKHLVEVRIEGEWPDSFPACAPGPYQRIVQFRPIAEHAAVAGSQRDATGACQGRIIDHDRGIFPGREMQRVCEHHPAFGVSVNYFD